MTRALRLVQLITAEEAAELADVLYLARHFSRQGQVVTVVGPLPRYSQEQVVQAGARWVNLPLPGYDDLGGWLRVTRQLRRLLASLAPDLVHAHGLFPSLSVAVATRNWRSRPRLVMGLPDLGALPLTPAMRWLSRWALPRATEVAVSTTVDRDLLARLHAPAARRARLVHQGVEVKPLRGDFDVGMKRRALGLNPQTAVVGVVSPAISGLGLETFLRAARIVSTDFPNVEFLLVGDGADQEALKLVAHDLGIGGNTVFRGTRVDIAEIIGALNLLVVPHEIPGAVRHALQALVQEIPLVATHSPALDEVLSNLSPESLIAPADPEAMATAIARSLELLPPPGEGEVFTEGGISLSYQDMLVARDAYDLDQTGLEAENRDEAPVRRAAEMAMRQFSASAMIRATAAMYEAALHGDRT